MMVLDLDQNLDHCQRSKFVKIVQPLTSLWIDGWILKYIGTHVSLFETECRAEESN